MAQYDGSIRINTRLMTADFEQGASRLMGGMERLGGSIKGLMGSLGLAIGIAGLVRLGKQAIDTASDIQEVQNVVDTAFGEMSGKMEQFANAAVKQFGMSKLSAKQMGSTFMAMGRSMVDSMEDASNMAIALTGRAADMASFYNKSAQETATALKSIYTGETETLKAYGVVMTEVNLQEYAAEKGIHKKLSAMTQAEKVQLRYNYVMEQTSLAAGDFAKTSDSLANQTRILSEQFKELLSILGSGLITVLTPVVKFLNTVLSQLIAIAQQIGAVLSRLFGISVPVADASKITKAMAGNLTDAAGGADALKDGIEEAGKAAAKALAPFDDLNVLADKAGGGKGAGAGVAGGGFEIPKLDMKDEAAESQAKLADKFTYFLGKLMDAAKGALDALSKLWNEGLSLSGSFAWDTLRDFYNHFLVPVGKWVLGEGLTRLFNITDSLLKSINWNTLLKALRGFYDVLAKFAKFTFKAVLDFYEYFLSPVSTWVMNKALVLLLDTLTDLGNKIGWPKLNENLRKLWEGLSHFAVGIGNGLILFFKEASPFITSVLAGLINGIGTALGMLGDVLIRIPIEATQALGKRNKINYGKQSKYRLTAIPLII